METVNCAATAVVGAAYVAEVTLFTVNVPGGVGAFVPGVNAQVTPSSIESFGTVAVIVDVCPALSLVEGAWRMTLSKSDGIPAQLVQLLLCKNINIARQNMEGTPDFFTIATPRIYESPSPGPCR